MLWLLFRRQGRLLLLFRQRLSREMKDFQRPNETTGVVPMKCFCRVRVNLLQLFVQKTWLVVLCLLFTAAPEFPISGGTVEDSSQNSP